MLETLQSEPTAEQRSWKTGSYLHENKLPVQRVYEGGHIDRALESID